MEQQIELIRKVLEGPSLWAAPMLAATFLFVLRMLTEQVGKKQREQKVEQAEKEAFKAVPAAVLQRVQEILETQEDLQARAQEVSKIIDESRQAILHGNLFNLYNKQIERYQDETRSRASWSFYIALIAMFFGFAFVFWGGYYILAQTGWDHLAAGSAIAAIGGSISAFITRTFLDVHRLSLQQLNR